MARPKKVNRYLTLRGHIVTHDPDRFPSEFKEVNLAVRDSMEKVMINHGVVVRELLMMTFETTGREGDRPIVEGVRIPSCYVLTLAQALAEAAYGRSTQIDFKEGLDVVVRDDWLESNKGDTGGMGFIPIYARSMHVSCSDTLCLLLSDKSGSVKTILFRSGQEASIILLSALGELVFQRPG